MKTVSMQQLWEEFRTEMEFPLDGFDIPIAKILFAAGALATMNALANHRVPDPENATEFAMREIDQVRAYGRPAHPAASDQ